MFILIPAYEPDDRLINLIIGLKQNCIHKILVIDDGSGENYNTIFENVKELGCTLLKHEKNQGKGSTLKIGFAYIKDCTNEKVGVVTADADGQHLVKDILAIAYEVAQQDENIVLGERKLKGKIPLKSAIGNFVARNVFALASGKRLSDTQTGLRGFSVAMIPWLLTIKGDRFEYEMNMLLQAGKHGYGFKQIEIDTVYLSSNKSTHFRAIEDSVRILKPFFKFCASGISAASVDYFLLFLVQWLTKNLFLSVVIARVASSSVNFTVNKLIVFKNRENRKTRYELIQYYLLVCILLFVNYFILKYFSQDLHIWLLWSKVLTEMILFSISFTVQHYFIFNKKVNA
jgi:putative flippase GtrA